MTDSNSISAKKPVVGYRPRNRSGGYAILIGLLEGEQSSLESMRKKDIIIHAQKHSNTSLVIINNTFYNGWSSMKMLVKHFLVTSSGHPLKYSLTRNGRKMAYDFQNQIKLVKSSYGACQCEEATVQQTSSRTDEEVSTPDVTLEGSLNHDSNTSDEELGNWCSKPSLTLPSGSYEIVLICDIMEHQVLLNSDKGKTKTDMFQSWLESGIKFESRRLSCGDFIWIARSGSEELVLPYIVERKRLDDLSRSIIDSRYHEQKERIVSTGLKPIYLLEMNSFKGTLDRDTLMNAVFLTNIRDDFIVKFTQDVFETMRYLFHFTNTLLQFYTDRELHSKCSESQSQPFDSNLMIFDYFQDRFTKTIPLSLSDMFAKQLLQIPRITAREANAIIHKYPTLSHLLDRYKAIGEKEGRKLLEDISLNLLSAKRIGPDLSNTVYNLYN